MLMNFAMKFFAMSLLLTAAGTAALQAPPLWRSAAAAAPTPSWRAGLDAALADLSWPAEPTPRPDLVLLSVASEHASSLEAMTADVARSLGAQTIVGVVGAGVIGGLPPREMDQEPGVSILAGVLPDETDVTPFIVAADKLPVWSAIVGAPPADDRSPPSFLLFADPFSPLTQTMSVLDDLAPLSCVAGGLSCPPTQSTPSLALYTSGAMPRLLPAGSLVGLTLSGPNFEMHTATAQGAAPVGPPLTVTKAVDNLVSELDGKPALQALNEVAQSVSSDERLIRLMQRALLVGVASDDAGGAADGADGGADGGGDDEEDFLIRMVLGQDPGGGIYVGDEVGVGRQLRFHVRDEKAAHDDLVLLLNRYRLSRRFSPRASGRDALCSLLFSCNGRGSNMYGSDSPDHDVRTCAEILSEEMPIGGFFCNGEIGPVGAAGLSQGAAAKTHLHGFTSVFALLYDTSAESSSGGGSDGGGSDGADPPRGD